MGLLQKHQNVVLVRLNQLTKTLNKEQSNLNEAMATINETLNKISVDIVNNGKGRGGVTGMHGFIAEASECGIRQYEMTRRKQKK